MYLKLLPEDGAIRAETCSRGLIIITRAFYRTYAFSWCIKDKVIVRKMHGKEHFKDDVHNFPRSPFDVRLPLSTLFTYLHALKSVCFYLQVAYNLLVSERNHLASRILRTNL